MRHQSPLSFEVLVIWVSSHVYYLNLILNAPTCSVCFRLCALPHCYTCHLTVLSAVELSLLSRIAQVMHKYSLACI